MRSHADYEHSVIAMIMAAAYRIEERAAQAPTLRSLSERISGDANDGNAVAAAPPRSPLRIVWNRDVLRPNCASK
jgi:hypothetical protein